MSTGTLPFQGETSGLIFKAILDSDPPAAIRFNRHLPEELEQIISKALEKDRNLRYQNAADMRTDLQRLKRDTESGTKAKIAAARPQRKSKLAIWAGASLLIALVVVAGIVVLRSGDKSAPPDSFQWVQLTSLGGETFDPTLSPDGRMLAFLRGTGGLPNLYVKILPDGEPVQLTHDETNKLLPVFSPDGSRIAYGTSGLNWQTWVVPVFGGQPQLLLSNATGLSWVDAQHVMFSEIKSGVHLSVVAATESRSEQRDVYVPPNENHMAHQSYLSPDHKWVLVTEMGDNKGMVQCQLVPFSGGAARSVGPPGECGYAAWSPDGKWMYFNSDAGKGDHIWRQAFPDGVPQQLTAGVSGEDGIAIAPDGKSLITAVGSSESSVWMHDRAGERQVSQGDSCCSRLSSDGGKLFYVQEEMSEAGSRGELWVSDLSTGQASRVLPGIALQRFSLSPDDKQALYETVDANEQHHLWLSSTEHRFNPRQLRSASGNFYSQYAPSGRIYYVNSEGGHPYLYRMNDDGTKEEKITSEPIVYAFGISPDERFVVVGRTLNKEDKWWDAEAVPVAGGPWIPLCAGWCDVDWSRDGKLMYFHTHPFSGNPRTYVVPIPRGSDLPKLPESGFQSEKEMRAVASQVLEGSITPGPDSSRYTLTKTTSHSNLYRIPLR